jgi:ribosomal protein S12 methylthiotransferase
MATHARISANRLRAKSGTTQTVLIDSIDGTNATGRSYSDAPEIDGVVTIKGGGTLDIGAFAEVVVTATSEHDLVGRLAAGNLPLGTRGAQSFVSSARSR